MDSSKATIPAQPIANREAPARVESAPLDQQILQELVNLRQIQAEQLAVLQQIEQELRTVRWWRRFWGSLRFVLLLLVIGILIYLLADWQAWLQYLV
jgi:hypothetical protein